MRETQPLSSEQGILPCPPLESTSVKQWAKIRRLRVRSTALGISLLVVLGGIAWLLHSGGYLLSVSDPLPPHAQVAVVLAGSFNGEEARRTEAMHLLQEGLADRVMLSVAKVSYLGQWLPDLERRYIEQKYGSEVAQKVVVCELSPEVDSTAGEALALRGCLEQVGWHSVIVVTSNYHTRRARRIWKELVGKANPSFTVSVRGVPDGDFDPSDWLSKRRYTKTWVLEFSKLVWTYLFGANA